jgi:hypothetical protein
MMADISEYSIVNYQRKYGHWRAAIFPKARIGRVGGVVTPDDFASEAEAQFAAEKLIRKPSALLPVSSSSITAHRPGAPKRKL